MTGYAITAGVILAAGAYLRFAVTPVLMADKLGKAVEHAQRRLQPSSPTPGWPGRHWPPRRRQVIRTVPGFH